VSLSEYDPSGLITPGRDTGSGFHLSARSYPTGDVELSAIRLNPDDSLRRGGGAKRKNSTKKQMDPVTLEKSVKRSRTTVRRKCLALQADRMLTLTFRDNVTDLSDAWKCLKYFTKLMRWRYGDQWAYIAVPERQKRGAVHFHLAIRGFYNVRTLRRLWLRAAGHREGNIDITSPRKHGHNDWNPSLIAAYLAKYMGKGMSEDDKYEDGGFNKKRYSSGGGIVVPAPINGWLAIGAATHSVLHRVVENMTRKDVRNFNESKGYFDIIYIST
jgi:hypothetical protein